MQSLIPRSDPRIAFFNRLAPTWDQTGPDPAVTLRRLREIRDELGLAPGQNLLEVGCGTGQVTAWLRERVRPGRVLSADFSPAMLKQARRRLPEADFRLWDVCAASARLPASDPGHPGGQELHRFDVVWCFHVFPHLRDQAGALRRMASWLAPGGQFVVLHLAGSAALNAFHHQVGGAVGDDRLPALPEFEAMLEPAGLRRIRGEDRDDLFLLRAVRAS